MDKLQLLMEDQLLLLRERDAALKWVDRFFWWVILGLNLPYKVIRTEGDPYLLRVYLYRGERYRHVYLHYFFRSDLDRDPHSHPVDDGMTSYSLILAHGYQEERLAVDDQGKSILVARQVKPFTINKIYSNTFHKVTLNNGRPWTLFFPGWRSRDPDKEDWYFWDMEKKSKVYWKDYIEKRDL